MATPGAQLAGDLRHINSFLASVAVGEEALAKMQEHHAAQFCIRLGALAGGLSVAEVSEAGAPPITKGIH